MEHGNSAIKSGAPRRRPSPKEGRWRVGLPAEGLPQRKAVGEWGSPPKAFPKGRPLEVLQAPGDLTLGRPQAREP
ncbi:hypothetical protein CRG98_024153 [Punica granatum]|uniref:Uncharacterized protein n=1 Tax=Punica granatum TaxID=22663 RepID=A0A2I0JHP1_PUNGR|nr:hypothetical protein CRG98_024153 [Punica granatum]